MIFYFTGTGNSFSIAKHIAAKLKNEQIMFIPDLLNSNTDLSIYRNEKRIGIVFPCYGSNPPKIVLEFCKKLSKAIDFSEIYTYAVINYGMAAHAAYLKLKSQLPKLDGWFETAMPGNGILLGDVPDAQSIQNTLSAAEDNINKFAKDIEDKKETIMYKNSFSLRLLTNVGSLGNKIVLDSAWKKFYADDNCTRCGKCTKICPTHNITFKESPVWGNNCTSCLGCIHRCPHKAIQNGKGTINKGRYIHPEFK
jgi:ferredoxin/flavodoxin